MDIVYPIAAGGHDDELRYSLRSVEKNLQGIDRVIIVGYRPAFLQNVIHVDFDGLHKKDRALNIFEKVLAGSGYVNSDQFILLSDDVYIVKSYQAESLPYYYCGVLAEMVSLLSHKNYYRAHVLDTIQALTSKGHPSFNYNVHGPVRLAKKRLNEIATTYNWYTGTKGFILKSLYCNSFPDIGGEQLNDCKIHTPKTKSAICRKIKATPFFSTNEHSVNKEMLEVLQELFPLRSRWENKSPGVIPGHADQAVNSLL